MANIFTLNEVCESLEDGNWIESKDQSKDGVRLIQTGNIKSGYFEDNPHKVRYISEETFNRLNCKEVFEGDILISRLPDPVGRGCILPKLENRSITAVDCAIVKVKKNIINNKYLLYFLQSPQYQFQVNQKVTGTTRSRISRKNLGEINIPVPSLQEQEKIVEKLDKVFENIEKKNNSIKDQLSNLDQLQISIMEKIFSNLNGKVYDLGDIVNLLNGRAYKKEELLDQGKYKVLRVGNLFTSNKWYFSDLELDKDKYCNKGDLLYAWSASFGPHFWNEDSTIYHYHIWKLQFDKNVIDKDFLYFWLLYDKEKVKKASGTGTTMMHVSKTSMQKRTLTLPPIKEQEKIAQNLNLVFNLSKELTNKYHKKSELNKSLENSLLHKEFSYE